MFLCVATWVISAGKIEEHDEAVTKWWQYYTTLLSENRVPNNVMAELDYFDQRYGPLGGRVCMIRFWDQAHYDRFWKFWHEDEVYSEFENEWVGLIDPGSYRVVFWDKLE